MVQGYLEIVLHQPGQRRDNLYAALYFWKYQRDDSDECRRVCFMDASAPVGGANPQRDKRCLRYHLSELCRRLSYGYADMFADAE